MVITVCIGSSCHLKGSREIVHVFRELIHQYHLEDKVELNGSFCMGECTKGVCVKLQDTLYSLSPKDAESFFQTKVISLFT